MPGLNPQIFQLHSRDMPIGIADIGRFEMAVHKKALHAVVGMGTGVVGRRRVIGFRPGIDPLRLNQLSDDLEVRRLGERPRRRRSS